MATVNNLVVLLACVCGDVAERTVEFRYGRLRQIKYYVGSAIDWGSPRLGDPSDRVAVVQGWLQGCDQCLRDGDVAVLVRSGTIVGLAAWDDVEWLRTQGMKVYRYED